MAKKVKAPKGAELKLETKSDIRQGNIKRTLANVKKYSVYAPEGKPPRGVKEIIADTKVKRAFKLGKNAK